MNTKTNIDDNISKLAHEIVYHAVLELNGMFRFAQEPLRFWEWYIKKHNGKMLNKEKVDNHIVGFFDNDNDWARDLFDHCGMKEIPSICTKKADYIRKVVEEGYKRDAQ